jgi:asparagine synthase (glutamine-hydrolysing)
MTRLIAAYIKWEGDAPPERLSDRVARALSTGMVAGQTGLARRTPRAALAMAPAARGWMPARGRSGLYVLFAGHIDNRAALRRDLGIGASDDAALFAAARDAWGNEADLRVLGAFAVILHHPDRNELEVVRSPLTGPPLHLWHDSERSIVASVPGPLFATGEVPRELDEQKVADSLYLNYHEYSRSWFRGVTRLPVGCRAVLDREGISIDRYYDPATLPAVRLASDAEYVEAAEALFSEATAAALEGAYRPSVSLSGGIDSQAVAAEVLRQRPGKTLDGFCSVPESEWDGQMPNPRWFGDEWPHVAALAEMYPDLSPHRVRAEGRSFDHRLEAMFFLTGVAPRNAMAQFWLHAVRDAARATGCDRILTGGRGNITFSFDGSGALPGWLARGQWGRLARELWRGGSRRHVLRRAWYQAIVPYLPDSIYRRFSGLPAVLTADPIELWCPLNQDYMREMQVKSRAADLSFDPMFRAKTSSRAARVAMLSGAGQEAPELDQGMAILHGVETRDPTTYRPLLEFCFGLPDDQYLRNGVPRWLARRMLAGRIPQQVLEERRRGLQSADWYLRLGRQRDALMAELDGLAQDPDMASRLDLTGLQRAMEDWTETTPKDPYQATRLRNALPRALVTARFIRYVDGRNDPAG